MAFNFKKFWLELPKGEREAFASETGTTTKYISTHLIGRTRIPTKTLMDKMFNACKERKVVTEKTELLEFFYSK